MKANQTEGKRHSWKEKGKKILSPALLCLCAVMLLVWAVQLLFFEDAYRFIKSWKLEDVMEQVCEHLDKAHLPQIVEELRLDNIDIRVIDAQGNDWVKNDAETCRILTGYTRQELAELYQQASARGETDIKQVTHVKMVYGDADSGQRSQTYHLATCAKMVRLSQEESCLVLICSAVTPSLIGASVIHTQLWALSIPLLLAAIFAVFFCRRFTCGNLRRMQQCADCMEQGGTTVRFPEQGCYEIRTLGRRLNCALQKMDSERKKQQETLANLSHDLRSPLTMIIGYAQMMQELPQENTPENLQVILDEAQRLAELTGDLLDLGKLQKGSKQLQLTTLCLTNLLADLVKRYRKMLGDSGLSFESDCRIWVKADPVQLGRVIYNFINNAYSHTGSDRKIIVRQLLQEKKVCIQVIDNGEGIPEDKLSNIWERYYKMERSKQSVAQGSGLGLCIARELLGLHGAEYGVESRVGEGSTFWFTLDALDVEPILPELSAPK